MNETWKQIEMHLDCWQHEDLDLQLENVHHDHWYPHHLENRDFHLRYGMSSHSALNLMYWSLWEKMMFIWIPSSKSRPTNSVSMNGDNKSRVFNIPSSLCDVWYKVLIFPKYHIGRGWRLERFEQHSCHCWACFECTPFSAWVKSLKLQVWNLE